MGEIKINYDAVDAAISSLEGLKSACDENSTAEGAVGGGGTVSNLEALEQLYADLFTAFHSLLDGTITMLRQSSREMADAERRAAAQFEAQQTVVR